MVSVGKGLAAAVLVLVVVLGWLDATTGLDAVAWAVGMCCGLLVALAVARGAGEASVDQVGPADDVTLGRAMLACVLAALVAQSFIEPPALPLLVGLAVVTLALDAVDGPVARRTGTASRFGARLDGEADAFLMLVLSVYVARSYGAWVLVIGAARYAFAVAGWLLPWLRSPLPFRYWRKVVTATQGVVLVVAAANAAPHAVTYTAMMVALALLAESFGRDVLWLWRHRSEGRDQARVAERGRLSLP